MKISSIILCILFAISSAKAADVTVKGSDTMIILAQKWASDFMAQNPGINVQVTGGGSGIGIAALLNGTTDLALASREMKPKESADMIVATGAKPSEIKTAMDGIGIYVMKDNPVAALTIAQLADIFTGKITNWKAVGGPDLPITIYSRENSSGTYAFFKEFILQGADFSPRAQAMPGTAALVNAVAKDRSGIGYGGIGYAEGIKSVPVKKDATSPACLATLETVHNGQYPISRYLYIYANPKVMTPEIEAFIKFVTGPVGQKIVSDVHFFPLPGVKVAEETSGTPAPATPVTATTAAGSAAPAELPPASQTATAAPGAPPVTPAETQKMMDREITVMRREVTVAEREAAAAMREMKIAEREMVVAEREAILGGKPVAKVKKP